MGKCKDFLKDLFKSQRVLEAVFRRSANSSAGTGMKGHGTDYISGYPDTVEQWSLIHLYLSVLNTLTTIFSALQILDYINFYMYT